MKPILNLEDHMEEWKIGELEATIEDILQEKKHDYRLYDHRRKAWTYKLKTMTIEEAGTHNNIWIPEGFIWILNSIFKKERANEHENLPH